MRLDKPQPCAFIFFYYKSILLLLIINGEAIWHSVLGSHDHSVAGLANTNRYLVDGEGAELRGNRRLLRADDAHHMQHRDMQTQHTHIVAAAMSPTSSSSSTTTSFQTSSSHIPDVSAHSSSKPSSSSSLSSSSHISPLTRKNSTSSHSSTPTLPLDGSYSNITTSSSNQTAPGEIDPRYGVEKRLVPTGPNPLHN